MSFSLHSTEVSFEGDFPIGLDSIIEAALLANTDGRGDISFSVSNYSENSDASPYGKEISFDVTYAGKVHPIVLLDRNGLESAINQAIEDLLYYEDQLFRNGLAIDFIYKNSYSISSAEELKLGSTLNAIDTNGKVRGVFEVSSKYDEYDVLIPTYSDRLLPGIALESAGAYRYAFSASSSFDFSSFALWAEIGSTEFIYPMIPKLLAGINFSSSNIYAFAGLGVESYLFLNTVFPNVDNTFIQEGRVGANAFILLGADGSFRVDSLYSVFYEHRVLANLMWRVGYSNLPGSLSGLSLSIGGSF